MSGGQLRRDKQLGQIRVMHDWMKSSPVNSGVAFLLADLDTALTFLDIAKTTTNEETRQRNFENARKAYDTVLQLMQKLSLVMSRIKRSSKS